MGLWFTQCDDGPQPWQPTAESGAIRVQDGPAGYTARILAALRAAPLQLLFTLNPLQQRGEARRRLPDRCTSRFTDEEQLLRQGEGAQLLR
jgi:hypothetical protein